MLKPPACSLHTQQQHHGLELPHTRQGRSKLQGPGFTSPCKQVFLQFSIWTATLLILPENRDGGGTWRGSRRLPPVWIWGLLKCSWGRGAQGSKASPGEPGSRGFPRRAEAGDEARFQWDALHLHLPWPANTSALQACTAPWALLHGCYGRQFFLLFLVCWQICCYLSAGLVSESVWVTSFAS